MKKITLIVPDEVFTNLSTKKQAGISVEDFACTILADAVGPRSVTLKDIAAIAHVSLMAVSFALNGHHNEISVETARNIKEIAKRLGYRPNSTARALRKKRS